MQKSRCFLELDGTFRVDIRGGKSVCVCAFEVYIIHSQGTHTKVTGYSYKSTRKLHEFSPLQNDRDPLSLPKFWRKFFDSKCLIAALNAYTKARNFDYVILC